MPSISLGSMRVLSLLVVALLGVLVEISVPPFGLPSLPETLSQGWDRFYSPFTREVGFIGALLSALALALTQYKERVQESLPLILTPITVGIYLSLPHLLPTGIAPGIGAVFLLASQLAIVLAVLSDLQPEQPGRPSYVTALGFLIALVMYLGAFPTAAGVPYAILGTEMPAAGWGGELMAVLVLPAFLIFGPMFKGIWHRPPRGFWFAD